MSALTAVIILGGALILWLSHRIYPTYAQVVAREERARMKTAGKVRPDEHIGPKCFALINFVVLFILIRLLESLAFDTNQMSESRVLLLSLTHFSGLVALWVMIEGRNLRLFYGKLARVSSEGVLERPSPENALTAFWKRNLRFAFAAMVALPLLLESIGISVGAASKESLLIIFGVCFMLPQIGLLAVVAHRLEPLRQRAAVR